MSDVRHVRGKAQNERKDVRKCYSCGKPGHIKSTYPETKVSSESSNDVNFVHSMDDKCADQGR